MTGDGSEGRGQKETELTWPIAGDVFADADDDDAVESILLSQHLLSFS